ncbi:MAG: regulatory protein NosR [Rhodospirillaceae bacterium]|jgi:NosR/NirI family transcriptional regulator, nitrous oxide reductase regulator|nr:regulatory protein NosR [Rhodospirillaceae bacterium]
MKEYIVQHPIKFVLKRTVSAVGGIRVMGYVIMLFAMATLLPPAALARHDQATNNANSQNSAAKPSHKLDRGQFGAVMPEATSYGKATGAPLSVAAYKEEALIGYIFNSRAVVASAGYSGRPLDILVGINLAGIITGTLIIEHHEPILEIGVSDNDLQNFITQFVGLDIRNPIKIKRNADRSKMEINAISGASVSSIVLNDAVLRSARAVARSRGILGEVGKFLDFDSFEKSDWRTLVEDGSITRRRVTIGEASRILEARGAALFPEGMPKPDPASTYIDLYFGLATPAQVSRNLVKDQIFQEITAKMADGDQLLFLAAKGLYSFRGRNYRKLGFFDRLQIIQREKSFHLTTKDHIRIDRLAVKPAPDFREMSFFILPKSSGFDPAADWRLELIYSGESKSGTKSYASVMQTYSLPKQYFRKDELNGPVPEKLWINAWENRIVEISVLIFALLLLTTFFFFQDWGARRVRLYNATRMVFLVATLVGLGWYANAQLSVVNILTFIQALLSKFHWDFFLLEPLIFILWGGVALSLLFWGRGAFCGWLCPFGALQELLSKVAVYFKLRQIRVPWGIHERLWPLKYIIFVAIFAIYMGNEDIALIGAEIEPFKTAIILAFDRSWPFVLYAVALLAVGLFIERFFCRYICPLGAALAIPARLRMFEWLKRRWQCGLQCNICADQCPVQAIHPDGKINPNECTYCLKCQVIYNDDLVCPPLAEKRKRKESRLTKSLVKRMEDAELKGEET